MTQAHPDRDSSRDIDIGKPGSSPRPRTHSVWLWLVVFVLSAYVFVTVLFNGAEAISLQLLVVAAALVLVAVAAWLGWILIVRRGLLTWLRLAWAPARAMARGDSAAAERALQAALARARRFGLHDYRRGLMLVELAGFVKNQGRYAEAKSLFEESIEILGKRRHTHPMDYFIALNNYAICFIHLRDHAAAQSMLEKVLDLTLAGRRAREEKQTIVPILVEELEMVLHLNLVFLFTEMHELAEAEEHLHEADAIFVELAPRRQARYRDHYRAIRALVLFAQGRFADANHEVAKAGNSDYPACLRLRAKLHLVRQEFADAERLLRRYLDGERKKGPTHRPELRDHVRDLAESLFGQGKHDEAFAALDEARAIAADFALPPDTAWRRTLDGWLQRADELGRQTDATALRAEVDRMPALSEHAITISNRLRIRR